MLILACDMQLAPLGCNFSFDASRLHQSPSDIEKNLEEIGALGELLICRLFCHEGVESVSVYSHYLSVTLTNSAFQISFEQHAEEVFSELLGGNEQVVILRGAKGGPVRVSGNANQSWCSERDIEIYPNPNIHGYVLPFDSLEAQEGGRLGCTSFDRPPLLTTDLKYSLATKDAVQLAKNLFRINGVIKITYSGQSCLNVEIADAFLWEQIDIAVLHQISGIDRAKKESSVVRNLQNPLSQSGIPMNNTGGANFGSDTGSTARRLRPGTGGTKWLRTHLLAQTTRRIINAGAIEAELTTDPDAPESN